jgi:hypothetical protein
MDQAIVPWSGEALSLTDTPAVARSLKEARQFKTELTRFIQGLEGVLLEHMDEHGKHTLRFGDTTIRGDTNTDDYDYDVTVLQELLDAGLPADRFSELVQQRVEFRVMKNVAKEVAASRPEYREILDRARVLKPKTRHVW